MRTRLVQVASVLLLITAVVTGAAALMGAGDTDHDEAEPPAADVAPTTSGERDTTDETAYGRRERGARRRVGDELTGEADVDAEEEGEPTPEPPLRLASIVVSEGETRRLPADRPVHVTGDIRVAGTLDAARTTLVLDGGDQLIEGRVVAHAFVLRGGTKRLRGSTSSSQTQPSQPGEGALYVDENTTLLLGPDAQWTVPNPYGFRIAGHLVIDGGTFHCKFTNGNGDDRGEEAWVPGSSLTIHSGTFLGRGDADFSGATVTIYDGELAIEDDLWDTGETLNVYGGVVRNATRGGAFVVKGALNMSAGELLVYQSSSRGLQVRESASVACSGGRVAICGRAATRADGGIYLRGGVTFFDLDIEARTRIRDTSDATAYLAVTGQLRIAKGGSLDMRGRPLLAEFTPTAESGTLVE